GELGDLLPDRRGRGEVRRRHGRQHRPAPGHRARQARPVGPVINDRITDQGVIQGQFTPEEANDLALVLKAGALPAGLTYLEERTVGPSLGLDSIRKGVTASIAGALLVFVAVVLYYRLAGWNAVLALILNAVLLLGAMALFGSTLTLPGIA